MSKNEIEIQKRLFLLEQSINDFVTVELNRKIHLVNN